MECQSQSEQLEAIKVQTTLTNGRVNKAETTLSRFDEIAGDLKQMVGTKHLVEKVLNSKFSWIIAGIFIIGLIKIIIDPNVRENFHKFFM